MSLENKSVLVTGYGFVGKHLVNHLIQQKADITVMDRNIEHIHELRASKLNAKFINIDIRHLNQSLEFDYVFHTASVTNVGYAETNYIKTFDDNVVATLNLLKHVKVKERFVFTSSAVVYSNKEGSHAENEDLKPISIYGMSKVAAETLLRNFSAKAGFDYTTFRFFNIYGVGQSTIYLVPQFLEEAMKSKRITVLNTTSKRDFVFIKDIVEGITKLAQQDNTKNEAINIGTGKATSTGEVAEMISKLLGGGIPVEDKHIYDPASLAVLIADTTKASKLGFQATTPLEEGLKQIIATYHR